MSHTKKTLLRTTSIKGIKKGYVDSPFGQIHYWTAGEGENLLMVHQSSASGEEYAALVPHLSHKYRVISYDWPGNGLSDDPDYELGVEEYTQSALVVLDHLNVTKCHVLGHHGGALVAMNIAYLQPERVGCTILSGTSGMKSEEESKKFKENLPVSKEQPLTRDGKQLSEAWVRYTKYQPEAIPQEVLRTYINHINTRLRPYDAHFGVLRWDRNPALLSLKGPVLLIQGTLDTFVSKQESLLDILPNAQRKVVESAGAFMFYFKPELCAKTIDDYLSSQ